MAYNFSQEDLDRIEACKQQDAHFRKKNGKSICYIGNTNLKKDKIQIDFSEDMLKEWIKCKLDPIYFVNAWVKIVNVDDGLVPFNTRDYQDKVIKTAIENNRVLLKFPRQSGKCQIGEEIIKVLKFNKYMKGVFNKLLRIRQWLEKRKRQKKD